MEAIIVYLTNTFLFTKTKAFIAFLIWLFWIMVWWLDAMKQALFMLLILDFFLWFVLAFANNTLSKKRMQLWIVKIFAYCIVLIAVNYTNIAIWWITIYWFWLMEFMVWYLALNELISILRHLWKLWVPIPKWLINKLENYKDSLELKDFMKWNSQKQ